MNGKDWDARQNGQNDPFDAFYSLNAIVSIESLLKQNEFNSTDLPFTELNDQIANNSSSISINGLSFGLTYKI